MLNAAVESPSSSQHLHPRSFRVVKIVAWRGTEEPRALRPVAPQAARSGELVDEPWGLKGAPTRRRGGGAGGEMREEEKG